ncbi:MAG: hypothetical protein Kilf2KO_30970 [Rhodospirillales bacterium]
MRLRSGLALGLSAALLVACGGREAREVAVRGDHDEVLSCFQLKSEYNANLDSIGFIRSDELARESANLGAIAGVLVGGVGMLGGLDFGTANAAELQAFVARNRRIEVLSQDKGCPPLTPGMDEIVAGLEAEKAKREAAQPLQPREN